MKLLILLAVLALEIAVPARLNGAAPFEDATASSGISFVHVSPFTEERHTHLTFGSGVAWLDFDRDDRPDLFAAQGAPFPKAEQDKFAAGGKTSDRLFRNLGGGRFADVSEAAGLEDLDYSMGVAVGDFDNDGFPDVYVTNFGKNRLHKNNGDGTFDEIAGELGVDDPRFGASATWVDLDGDGNLDLYATNYLDLDPKNYQLCSAMHEGIKYFITCHPRSVPAVRDVLYRSHGDGSFSDWTEGAGLMESPPRQGLGVVAADLDADRDVDIYVANDSVPNDLWVNQGEGRLINEGLISGTALNRSGQREAGMGVVAGDVDGDGRPELFVTNYYAEQNTLYRNEGEGLFLDVTEEFGLAGPTRVRLGFGTNIFDYDSDGWLDLFMANGHVHDQLAALGRDVPFAQKAQLFRNQAGRRFEDVSDAAGAYFQKDVVGRSSAAADYDRDGRIDLAVGHLNSQLVLLHNEFQNPDAKNLRIELVGVQSNRDAIGAVVEIQTGNRRLTRFRVGSSGYLSTDEGVLTIGLGNAARTSDVTIRWPGGKTETFPALATETGHVLIEGQGESR